MKITQTVVDLFFYIVGLVGLNLALIFSSGAPMANLGIFLVCLYVLRVLFNINGNLEQLNQKK